MRATYYISFDGVTYSQFYPTNEPKVKMTQEPGEIFFRWKIDSFRIGKTLNSTIYATLLHYFFTTEHLDDEIRYQIKENGVTTFEFVDPIIKGRINTQNSVFECSPEPDDAYRPIMQQYERDWHRGNADNAFHTYQNVFYPTKDTTAFSNVDFTSWTESTVGTVSYTNTSSAEKFARNTLGVAMDADRVVVIIIKNLVITAGDEPFLYLTNAGGDRYSTGAQIIANGIYTLTSTNVAADRVEISQTDSGDSSEGSFDYEIYHYDNYAQDSQSVYTAIDCVLNNTEWMNLSVATVMSTFLFNSALGSDSPTPIATAIAARPTYDYVTNGPQNWNDLAIGRIDKWTTDKEDDFTYSLRDIMDVLKYKLRAWWFIDEDGHVRIEHEKYLRSYSAQANLTTATYKDDKPEVDAKIYNYSESELANQVNYIENNEANEDWIEAHINFPFLATSKNTRDVRINVTTDMKNVIDNAATISGSGFSLLKLVPMGGVYRLSFDESTKTAGNYYPNANLGWRYLFANYWEYFAEANVASVDSASVTFTHVKEFLTQENIRFHPAAAIDWKKPFTLANGTGWLTGAEYSPETGMIEISVGFNPYV